MEGSVKLLDIANQPLAYSAAKRRKKMHDIEDAKSASENILQSPTPTTNATSDDAAHLNTVPTYAPSTSAPVGTISTTTIMPVPVQSTPIVATTQVITTTPTLVIVTNPSTPHYVATSVRPVPPFLTTAATGQHTAVVTEQATAAVPIVGTLPIQVSPIQQPSANSLQRRGLSLTREQMLEAQNMFRTANKVTRPEKALILGFMAGSRDNPCPHLGNIVTIKLSEDQENILQPDNTYLPMLAETHFQMNYNNGEWKRMKKYRHIENLINEQLLANCQTAAIV